MEMFAVVLLLAFSIISIYLYYKWKYSYWTRKKVPQIQPEFFWGNIRDLARSGLSLGDQMSRFYFEAKAKGYKYIGIYRFSSPTYIPIDLDLIKHILQKDFNHFVNHGMYVNEKLDPLSGQLFNLEDEKWKNLRVKFTPTFTSGKMKMMFQTLTDCSVSLEDILNEHSIIQDPVDVKEVISRFTTDVVGSCAFGIDCNSLKNPNSEFSQFGKRIFEMTPLETIQVGFLFLLPRKLSNFLGLKLTPVDVEDFFINMVKNTIQYREQNNIYRKDFMHLMIQLKNKGEVTDDESITRHGTGLPGDGHSLSVNEIAAQCFVFFVAGFETSASTMTFALLELAQNQAIQDKLRKNIVTTLEKHDGQLTYETLMDIDYLDQVVFETLRMHPPIPGVPRVCNKPYRVPGTDVILERGTRIHVPAQAIQRDPEYYPDPDKFQPERFSEENRKTRPSYSFLAFGEGPRICIGARFGLMQAKVGLVAIIKNFKVTLNQKTSTPIKYESKRFITSVKGGVWLDVSKI